MSAVAYSLLGAARRRLARPPTSRRRAPGSAGGRVVQPGEPPDPGRLAQPPRRCHRGAVAGRPAVPPRARLRINRRNASFTQVDAYRFALHEVLGHALQYANLTEASEHGETSWPRQLAIPLPSPGALRGPGAGPPSRRAAGRSPCTCPNPTRPLHATRQRGAPPHGERRRQCIGVPRPRVGEVAVLAPHRRRVRPPRSLAGPAAALVSLGLPRRHRLVPQPARSRR